MSKKEQLKNYFSALLQGRNFLICALISIAFTALIVILDVVDFATNIGGTAWLITLLVFAVLVAGGLTFVVLKYFKSEKICLVDYVMIVLLLGFVESFIYVIVSLCIGTGFILIKIIACVVAIAAVVVALIFRVGFFATAKVTK